MPGDFEYSQAYVDAIVAAGDTPQTSPPDIKRTIKQLGGLIGGSSILPNANKSFSSPTGTLGETMSRILADPTEPGTFNATGNGALGSVTLYAGQIIGHLAWCTAGTAAVTPTHQWLGVYDSVGDLLARTADKTTTAIAAYTYYSAAIAQVASGAASTYTVPTTGLYYLGINVAAGTMPTMMARTGLAALTSVAPYAVTYDTTANTTGPPAFPYTIGGFGGTGVCPWVAALV